jgi:hypothetical protein
VQPRPQAAAPRAAAKARAKAAPWQRLAVQLQPLLWLKERPVGADECNLGRKLLHQGQQRRRVRKQRHQARQANRVFTSSAQRSRRVKRRGSKQAEREANRVFTSLRTYSRGVKRRGSKQEGPRRTLRCGAGTWKQSDKVSQTEEVTHCYEQLSRRATSSCRWERRACAARAGRAGEQEVAWRLSCPAVNPERLEEDVGQRMALAPRPWERQSAAESPKTVPMCARRAISNRSKQRSC